MGWAGTAIPRGYFVPSVYARFLQTQAGGNAYARGVVGPAAPIQVLIPLLWGKQRGMQLFALGGGGPSAPTIPLLTAGNFAMLAKTGISTVPASAVTGNVGLSPNAAVGLTGWAQVLDGSGVFSTSAQVIGQMFAADYAPPTPANLTQAVLDMQAAYTAAASVVPTVVGLNGGNIGGLILAPGVYRWPNNVTIAAPLTLTGGPAARYIFQIAGTLNLANAQAIILSGGVLPANVFWQVAGAVTIGTTAVFRGNILAQTLIAVQTNAVVHGKLFAQSAITLDKATVGP